MIKIGITGGGIGLKTAMRSLMNQHGIDSIELADVDSVVDEGAFVDACESEVLELTQEKPKLCSHKQHQSRGKGVKRQRKLDRGW